MSRATSCQPIEARAPDSSRTSERNAQDFCGQSPVGPESSQISGGLDTNHAENSDPMNIYEDLFAGVEPPPTGVFYQNDSFWPSSTAWQWTHEDLYLQGSSSLQAVEGGFDDTFTTTQDWMLTGQNSQGLPPRPDGEAEIPDAIVGTMQSRIVSFDRDSAQSMEDVVDRLVNLALTKQSMSDFNQSSQRHALSSYLPQMIDVPGSDLTGGDPNLLDRLISHYITHFHPLWPLIPKEYHHSSHCHPLLYLCLTSIGALYSGPNAAANYGSIMHTRIRKAVIFQQHRNSHGTKEALDIGRTMLLTQVAALYFEQDGAFSVAQQLGAILYAHAHRMRLFIAEKLCSRIQTRDARDQAAALAEGRRMLAYGMLRAETFMSVLFNRKPLLSYEEIDLPLPLGGFTSHSMRLLSQDLMRQDDLPCGGILFSDMVRIALDPDEVLPTLRPTDLELLLFGLQHDVWRFSHDPEVFMRLTSKRRLDQQRSIDCTSYACSFIEYSTVESTDALDYASRRMKSLAADKKHVYAALHKWKRAMAHSQLSYPAHQNRSAYLSGLILLELSFLRLRAPVEWIQQIAYELHTPASSGSNIVAKVTEWTFSKDAREATDHARSIWLLLESETSRAGGDQAKYNILALMALHHAAAVIWAIVGTDSQLDSCFVDGKVATKAVADSMMLQRANTTTIMLHFAELYPKITASWGMQSSFSKMVRKLVDHPFPTGPTSVPTADCNDVI